MNASNDIYGYPCNTSTLFSKHFLLKIVPKGPASDSVRQRDDSLYVSKI